MASISRRSLLTGLVAAPFVLRAGAGRADTTNIRFSLSAPFDGEYLYRITRKRSVAIKHLIMNSQLVVGVGNIYASEALFRARIAPRRSARRITKAEAQALTKAIKAVLSAAIKIGGTTLRDYVNAEGTPGYFRQKLFVYEREGLPCRVCKTPIKQFAQGQRSTYWCPGCQH